MNGWFTAICKKGDIQPTWNVSRPAHKHCPDCGSEVFTHCPACREPLSTDLTPTGCRSPKEFCTQCGKPLPWSGEAAA